MAFNPQQIDPINFAPSTAVGIDIPFNGNAVFKSNFQTKNAIKNNLINFFLTNPGDRFLNPTFGGGLRNFVFQQLDSNNTDFLKEDISNKIKTFFPNINIVSINIFQNNDFNSLVIDLNYQISNTNLNDTITFNL
jgi:phage baseplate assembly protein W